MNALTRPGPARRAARPIEIRRSSIDDRFWRSRLDTNRGDAVLYQWQQLEHAGTIDNFRIAAGEIDGFRRGYFYTDSDAHKWAEAAANVLAAAPFDELERLLAEYAGVLARAQEPDGYLFTYNQIHFPGRRCDGVRRDR